MRQRIEEHLDEIRRRGNYRSIRYLKPLSETRILYEGKEYLNLCSNNYLSLQYHPDILGAVGDAIRTYGSGTCSSRSVSGSVDLYSELELEAARYKGYEKGLIFSNGYMANIGIIATLTGKDDVIFTDELNHSSLIDSMRLSHARKVIYRHMGVGDLETRLKRTKVKGKRFIVTETIFSMDGDIAPLADIVALKERYDACLIIDDAHGTGVFGEKGTGIEELSGARGKVDVQMATFGKALGSFGAFALSDSVVIEYLVNRARTFMYTTALPASSLAASLCALRIIAKDISYKEQLWQKIDYFRKSLVDAGFDLKKSRGPIIPIVVGDDSRTVEMQKILLEKGIFLQAIRPPTIPEGTSRLRLTLVRGVSQDDMDYALGILRQAGKKMGLV